MRTADGQIINQCLDGNSAAFGFLVDKYKESVYALAYSMLHNFHDAEDVTQEVFIKAYRKLHTLKNYDRFHAWLFAITSNMCKDWIKSQSRRPDRDLTEDQDPKTAESYSMNKYREDSVYESVRETLEALPHIYSQVLALRYLGGMKTREMAQFLGTTPDTIKHRLTRARAHLKEEFFTMMNTEFVEQKLQAGFTFRTIETVKNIKIDPMPKTTALSWGLSLAAGIFLTIMSLSPHMKMYNLMAVPSGAPLYSETKVLKVGEIPVDIIDVSQTMMIANEQNNTDDEILAQNTHKGFALAPNNQGGTWESKADMPTARMELSVVAANGKIYAMGGELMFNGPSISTVEVYDPKTDSWTKRGDMPISRANMGLCEIDGKIYAIGGFSMPPFRNLATVEVYDPDTDTWTQKSNMPTPRWGLCTAIVNGKIYAIGGAQVVNSLAVVEEYDPDTDTWTRKADMPTARQWFYTGVLNGKIYAIGGAFGNAGNDKRLAAVEEYDPITDTWTKKADLPMQRCAFCVNVVNGKLYIIGGLTDFGVDDVATIKEYDPITDTWIKKANMPTARCSMSSTVIGDRIYLVGGNYNFALSTLETYTPNGLPHSVSPQNKMETTWGEIKAD